MMPALRRRFHGGVPVRNLLKNSTSLGAVAGTPGTLPKNWNLYAPDSGAGISTQVVGTGIEDGIDYIDFRVFGTPSTGGSASVRAASTLTYAQRTNSVMTKPTGTASGDVLVMLMNIQQAAGSAPAVTPPSGFTEQTSPGSYTDPGNNNAVWHVYTKLAGGSEPSSYNFTHAQGYSECILYAISGADSSISIVVGSIHQGLGTTTNFDAITTTRNNAVVIAWGLEWDDATGATAASGSTPTFTTRFTGVSTAVSDGVWSGVGSTGAKTLTVTNSNSHNFGVLIAVQPTSGSANGNTGVFFTPASSTQLPCAIGRSHCLSAFVKLAAGALPDFLVLQQNYENGAFTYLGAAQLVMAPSASKRLRDQRFVLPATCDQASASFLFPNINFNYSGALDCTIRIGLPQIEYGLSASTPERKASF
jgi:hypothetical protein